MNNMIIQRFLLLLILPLHSIAQIRVNLPVYNQEEVVHNNDWLIGNKGAEAKLYKSKDGKLGFSNGIVARTFSISPNCATVGLDLLSNHESFLRSVRPEAEIEISGLKFFAL